MDLTSDKIPNKMLTGTELLECAVAEFREMLKRDCMFIHTIAYRRVAFTLQATFHLGYPHPPDHVVKSRTKKDGVLEGEVPLNPPPDEDESRVLALEPDVNLDNPNLARITHGLPITVQEKLPPRAMPLQSGTGEAPDAVINPFPDIVTHKLKYDPTQYPKGPEPVDRDVSDKKAAELGMKQRKRG